MHAQTAAIFSDIISWLLLMFFKLNNAFKSALFVEITERLSLDMYNGPPQA